MNLSNIDFPQNTLLQRTLKQNTKQNTKQKRDKKIKTDQESH